MAETYNQGQSPSSLGVDKEQCRDRENDLDSTITERGVERFGRRVADFFEDGGTVEGDN